MGSNPTLSVFSYKQNLVRDVRLSLKEFDEDFIELARSVYKVNDERSLVKREINLKYNSGIVEEKSYKNY